MHPPSRSTVPQASERAYRRASACVQSGRRGQEEHDSLHAPFLRPCPDADAGADAGADAAADAQGIREVDACLERVPLPGELQRVYRVIARPRCEYIFGNWTLMSLRRVCEQYEQRKTLGQSRAVDFALTYAGLGHYTVCSYDPVGELVYDRMDGGSNGYDRMTNFAHANQHVPAPEDCRPVTRWMDEVCSAKK